MSTIIGPNIRQISSFQKIIESSNSQSAVVRRISELHEDTKTEKVEVPALAVENTFKDVESFSTAVFLALRARPNTRTITFLCGDYESTGRSVGTSLDLSSSNKKDIAKEIAGIFIKNPKAVGFHLEFGYSKDKPTRYIFQLFETRDGSERMSLYTRDAKELEEKLSALLQKIGPAPEAEAFRQLRVEEDSIRSNALWKPAFIITAES